MELIFEDKKRRVIQGKEGINFSSYSSYHLVEITARAEGEKQLGQGATDDEDLTVEIDGRIFPKLDDPDRLVDSPTAFSGGRLHNLSQTIYFLTFLKGRNHRLVLSAETPPGTATFESLTVYTLNLDRRLAVNVQAQAEDGDRRPWLTFALVGFPLVSFTPMVTYSHRKKDSDDLKIIIDGKVQGNLVRTIKHFLWRFVGSLLPGKLPPRMEEETFFANLPRGLHYLEFHADRTPTLHSLSLDLGNLPSTPGGIPSVNNPKWTGDFYDDLPGMILAGVIFGEAEGVSEKAKIWVGWTIKNRVLAQRKEEWGLTLHEVILRENQYEAFTKRERLDKMKNPLNTLDEKAKQAWFVSYRVAVGILAGSIPDLTEGATNFYSTPIIQVPYWATKEREKGVVDNLHFYKL